MIVVSVRSGASGNGAAGETGASDTALSASGGNAPAFAGLGPHKVRPGCSPQEVKLGDGPHEVRLGALGRGAGRFPCGGESNSGSLSGKRLRSTRAPGTSCTSALTSRSTQRLTSALTARGSDGSEQTVAGSRACGCLAAAVPEARVAFCAIAASANRATSNTNNRNRINCLCVRSTGKRIFISAGQYLAIYVDQGGVVLLCGKPL